MIDDLPLWLSILVSVCVLLGALLTMVGCLGLVRLRTFYLRIHAPTALREPLTTVGARVSGESSPCTVLLKASRPGSKRGKRACIFFMRQPESWARIAKARKKCASLNSQAGFTISDFSYAMQRRLSGE